jgi:hypothetical protein
MSYISDRYEGYKELFCITGTTGAKFQSRKNFYSLSQNYPNPFNPTTTTRFSLKQEEKTVLEVYNILGQKVATLINEELKADAHTYNWNASGQASGLYLYRLRRGSFTATKKMMLLK